MTKAKKETKREKAKWGGYVNFRPTDEEAKAVRKNLLDFTGLEGWLSRCADNGYKVSFRFDDYRDAPVCEVYGYWADCKNPGRTLTVAHNDLLVAASACRFFMETIAEAGEWPSDEAIRNPFSW